MDRMVFVLRRPRGAIGRGGPSGGQDHTRHLIGDGGMVKREMNPNPERECSRR